MTLQTWEEAQRDVDKEKGIRTFKLAKVGDAWTTSLRHLKALFMLFCKQHLRLYDATDAFQLKVASMAGPGTLHCKPDHACLLIAYPTHRFCMPLAGCQ